MLLVVVGAVFVAGAGLGAVVGPALGTQTGGDWAVVLVVLAAGLATLALGLVMSRR